ncbi:MAG TPA: HK97 family phage prohead protease [Gallionella sp.]
MNHSFASPPQIKHIDSPAEFKFAGSAGTFEGYAAVFGNVDSGGDVILPGAFQEFAKTKDGKTIVLYQHSLRDPIGKAAVSQDSHGLAFRGQLSLEDPTAKKAYGLMRDGVLDSMSIGYDVLPGGEQSKQGKRELSKLKLFEISAVTFGMNDLARIDTVKSAMDCGHTRELECLLRETLFLSKRKAIAAAAVLWPILNERDAQDDDRDDRLKAAPGQLISLASELNRITTLFKT